MTDTILFYLESLEKDVHTWDRRFKENKNDHIFTHYVAMSQQIREKVRLFLNPSISELTKLKEQYEEKYKHKDLPYHIDAALNICGFLKTLCKELVDLYENQAAQEQVIIRWDYNLVALKKRIPQLKSRLHIIHKILEKELVTENDKL